MIAPLTYYDLTEIAKRLKYWEKRLTGPDGLTDASNLVSRIEVHRPYVPSEIIGHFVFVDECLGFEFLEEK